MAVKLLPILAIASTIESVVGIWSHAHHQAHLSHTSGSLNASQCLAAAYSRQITPESPLPIYVHVQKTGGTTFSIALAQSYDAEDMLEHSCISAGLHLNEARNMKTASVGFGHIDPKLVEEYNGSKKRERQLSSITMLRDVVTHRKSFYFDKIGVQAEAMSPLEWVNSDAYEPQYQLSHGLARYNPNSLHESKAELCNMEYVGINEEMEDSLCLYSYKFQHRVELFTSYRVKDTQQRDRGWEDESVEMIKKQSEPEIKVYNFARELFDARVQAAKTDIKHRLNNGENVEWLCAKWAEEFDVKTDDFRPKVDAKKEAFTCNLLPRDKWCAGLCY